MLTFEKVYELTQTIGSNASFEIRECAAYFDLLMFIAPGSEIVEVGLQYGRSSSIALQVAKERGLKFCGIDPFEGHPEVKDAWLTMVQRINPEYAGVFYKRSTDVEIFADVISLILIDGDHSYEGVKADCEHFLPHVKVGGFAAFHDYQRESLPDITKAVDEYMAAHPEWGLLAIAGTLAVWRKR